MDVDVSGSSVSDSEGCGNGPSSGHLSGQAGVGGGSKLKRSSSAPMINQLVPQGPVSAPPMSSISHDVLGEVPGCQPRVRRFSASFGPVSPLSPGSSRGSGPLRVCQLRVEEGMDVVNREAAIERTVQSTLQLTDCLSQSWEDLTLAEDVPRPKAHSVSGVSIPSSIPGAISVSSNVGVNSTSTVSGSIRRDYTDPLHLTIVPTVVPLTGCGASPTRGGVGRQCFSPSLQQHVRNTSFCPSPSPTKKSFATRRSLSPIALRPSPLGAGLKRKWEMDDRCEPFLTPSKRASTCTPDRCVGGLLITQPHSVGSLESTPSPAGPGSLGSVGTPDSVCSSGSPGLSAPPYSPASIAETPAPTPDPPPHLFKPVSPALSTDQTASFGTQEHGDRFGGQEHGNRFGGREHNDHFNSRDPSEQFGARETRDHFRPEHNDRFRRQEHGNQEHRSQFGGQNQDHNQFGTQNQEHSHFGSQNQEHSQFGRQDQEHNQFGRQEQEHNQFGRQDQEHRNQFGRHDQQHSQFGTQNQEHNQFGRQNQEHNQFGRQDQEHRSQFGTQNQEHTQFGRQNQEHNQFGRQNQEHSQFGGQEAQEPYVGQGKGGDTSDGSSNDAMITEDVPANDLKTYQDMDLSESLAQPPLNI